MTLPDYGGGSIVNLTSSIAAARGGKPGIYPMLRELPGAAIAHARSIVLLLIDGLGYKHLRQYCAGSNLERRIRAPMTSVFPSTTASAVTSVLTGVAPQQHALSGWHMHLKELGAIVAVLPLRTRIGDLPLAPAGIPPATFFTCGSLFERISTPSHLVTAQGIVDSAYSIAHGGSAAQHGYRSAAGMFERIAQLAHAAGGPQYIHAYYPQIDTLAHEHGIASRQVAREFDRLDFEFGRFLAHLSGSDSLVIATADHGFVDTESHTWIDLDAHPRLAQTLVLPLCGEPRVAYCYVHPDRRAQFESYVHDELSDRCELHLSTDLIERGYFGLGAANPRLAERIGHYTLIMRGNFAMRDWLAGERRFAQIGVHGGLSESEMLVPLIVAEP